MLLRVVLFDLQFLQGHTIEVGSAVIILTTLFAFGHRQYCGRPAPLLLSFQSTISKGDCQDERNASTGTAPHPTAVVSSGSNASSTTHHTMPLPTSVTLHATRSQPAFQPFIPLQPHGEQA